MWNYCACSRRSAEVKSLRLNDFAAAQAAGANSDALAVAVYLGVNRAQIDVPTPPRHVVRVADVVSELRPLAADLTYLCHDDSDFLKRLVLNLQSLDFTGFRRFSQFLQD